MTRCTLDVLQVAVEEMADALAYYGSISPSLGAQFDEALNAALSLLCESPGLGSRRFAHLFPRFNLRTWSLDRFPFRIFYTVDGDILRVYLFRHERRNVTRTLLRGVK